MVKMSPLARIGLRAAVVLTVAAAVGACSSGPAGSPAPVTPVPSGVIAVEAKDFAFTPSALTASAGSVTFSVRNAGSQEHEFEIFQGETVVNEIEGLVPGLTKSLTLDLQAGDYTFMCKINGHDKLGMKGTVTVR